jgi:hypothetical protein
MSHPTLTRHADSTSEEIDRLVRHSRPRMREAHARTGQLELEFGPRLARRVAMCSMPLFLRLIQTSLSLELHPTVALVVRFIGRLMLGVHGLRCRR